MSIIVSKGNKNAQRIDRTMITQEVDLQKYIHDNPESIPLNEIQSDLRLLILAREFQTTSGPIDALGIDQNGDIYLIETKLATNTDKRLVLAQVLDYGAALWRNQEDSIFIDKIEMIVSQTFSVSLAEKFKDFYGSDDEDATALIQAMRQNLKEGKFRFVVLMDQLSDRLRDLITFVNQNSRFDIFGVELEFYKFQEYEILIPKLYGAEIKKDVVASTSSSTRYIWNESTFFERVRAQLPVDVAASIQRIYNFSKEYADDITWGSGAQTGSFNSKFSIVHPTKSLYSVWTNGALELNFQWLTNDQPSSVVENIGYALQKSSRLRIPQDFPKRSIKLKSDQWVPETEAILQVLTSALQPQSDTI